ncbi:unnamed protein product, partial [Iphiclides podalirius]
MRVKILFVSLFLSILDGVLSKEEKVETGEEMVMGLETVRDIEIDKDTIITNMKVENRNREAERAKKAAEGEPDWSYSSFPQEVSPHVEQFKRNMSECLKEVQANEKKTVRRLSPKRESPVHGECLIACVLKRNGVIINGKINKDNLMLLVSKFFAKNTKLLKKLDKHLDKCIEKSSKIKDECALASQLNDCTNSLMSGNESKFTVKY